MHALLMIRTRGNAPLSVAFTTLCSGNDAGSVPNVPVPEAFRIKWTWSFSLSFNYLVLCFLQNT